MRRRQVRRRRALAAAGLVTLTAAVVFLVLSGSHDKSNPATTGMAATVAPTGKAGNAADNAVRAGGAQPDSSWKPSRSPVPILMYHVIGEPAGEVTYPDLYVSVKDFRAQVDWLARNSYTAVTLSQVQDAWYDGGTLPEKPVVLSFDDGYLGQYLEAMPILKRQEWAGLLNLKAEGSDLSSKQVRKMIRAGWEVASHTVSHPDLTTISAEQLRTELVDSKAILERDLGVEIENFCYPAGQFNQDVVAAVKAAGYRGATTVEPGLADRERPFELKRIRINRTGGLEVLASDLGS